MCYQLVEFIIGKNAMILYFLEKVSLQSVD